MKILNQFRYFLFATTVLGCFANFAQNDYGLYINYYSQLFIGIIFLIEAFLFYSRTSSESKTKAIYLFTEHFSLALVFFGFFFRWSKILPPAPFLVLGALGLFCLYLFYAIRILVMDLKKGILLSILVFVFILAGLIAVNGLSWKLAHFPGANIMLNGSFYAGLGLMIFVLIKRKYSYDHEWITFKERIKWLPGKISMVSIYFIIWAAYVSLSMRDLAPHFYTLTNLPAYEKLRTIDNSKADLYEARFYNFLENRNNAGTNKTK